MELQPQQDLLNPEELRIVKFGTFWPRFWALLLDGLILAVLAPINVFNNTEWKSVVVLILITLVQVSYKSFFEYKNGATPGKMALRLRVVDNEFQKASLGKILARNIFQIISTLLAFCLTIYAFYQPGFEYASTSIAYTALGNVRTISLIINFVIFSVYIIDLIVMLTSDESKSLHDRIGGTYVIRD